MTTREKPVFLLPLDQPVRQDGSTIADILPDTHSFPNALPQHIALKVERAIASLPGKQRQVIEEYFGFYGTPVSLNQIGKKLYPTSTRPNSTHQYKRAILTLRQTLTHEVILQQAKAAGGTRV